MGIHNYSRMIEGSLSRLERADVSKVNFDHVMGFYHYLCTRGLSKARINRYLQTLKLFGELVEKDFKKMNKADLVKLVGVIESCDYTAWTKSTYKSMLKRFLLCLHGLLEHS